MSREGRKTEICMTKAEGVFRLTYTALALLKEIDKMLFSVVWKNRTHYLKKTVLMNTYEKGGLNLGYFSTLNNTFKNVIQLKWFTKNTFGILYLSIFYLSWVA